MKTKIQMWIVWHLPKWIISWAGIRLVAHATTGEYSDTIVPNLEAMEALRRWDTKTAATKGARCRDT